MKTSLILLALLASAPTFAHASPASESATLRAFGARESKRPAFTPQNAVKFKPSDHVFVKSVLAIDFTYRKATATLPLYRGAGPKGDAVYYIITDASDFAFAKSMGLNYAPKLIEAARSPGAQAVTMDDTGLIQFKGNVDFAPVYEVKAGSPAPFPPAIAKPGAVADAEWSSVVVLPSGTVVNIQLVANASGQHDRAVAVDIPNRTVTMSLLDGMQGGKQYYYHLVTDVSAEVPSVLEKGVYAPRLAALATFGKDDPTDKSALLGFSPNANGITDISTHQSQGFAASLANGGIDPINVFPIQPRNDVAGRTNNYSPLWDAHITVWTEKAMQEGKVHRIASLDEQKQLIRAGYLASAPDSPAGPVNAYVGGLRPSGVVINCPVIAQPELPPQ